MMRNAWITALVVVMMLVINIVPQIALWRIFTKGVEHFGEEFADGRILLHLFVFALTFAFTVDGIFDIIRIWKSKR